MAFDLRRPADWPARWIGLAVFLIGVGLLVVVFIWASHSLSVPTVDTGQPMNWAFLGTRLAWELGRLFLLGFIASAIASQGVKMYAVAGRAEAVVRSPLE